MRTGGSRVGQLRRSMLRGEECAAPEQKRGRPDCAKPVILAFAGAKSYQLRQQIGLLQQPGTRNQHAFAPFLQRRILY